MTGQPLSICSLVVHQNICFHHFVLFTYKNLIAAATVQTVTTFNNFNEYLLKVLRKSLLLSLSFWDILVHIPVLFMKYHKYVHLLLIFSIAVVLNIQFNSLLLR